MWATGEPMWIKQALMQFRALAARWIPRVEGCYFNVVGLPLALVNSLLEGTRAKRDRTAQHRQRS